MNRVIVRGTSEYAYPVTVSAPDSATMVSVNTLVMPLEKYTAAIALSDRATAAECELADKTLRHRLAVEMGVQPQYVSFWDRTQYVEERPGRWDFPRRLGLRARKYSTIRLRYAMAIGAYVKDTDTFVERAPQ